MNRQKAENRPIKAENKVRVARGVVGGEWIEWVKGSGRYQFPVLERVSRRDEMCSLENVVSGVGAVAAVTCGGAMCGECPLVYTVANHCHPGEANVILCVNHTSS